MDYLNSNKDRMMENIPAVLKHPCGSTLYGVIIGSGPAADRVSVCYSPSMAEQGLALPYSGSADTGHSKADLRRAGWVLRPLTRID